MAKDIQSTKPQNNFKLTRVGITGIKKLVEVSRGGEVITLTPRIDVFVDLPSNQKGSHLSRNAEVINEIVDESIRKPTHSLEELSAKISKKLLEKHEYANYSEVFMIADYFLEKKSPLGKKSLENYELIAKAIAKRNGKIPVKKLIGVKVIGMTACPCAMETVRSLINANDEFPVITHNQRNITTLMIEVPEQYEVEANDLIEIVEQSLSSPTHEILKRGDEAEVVLRAHKNPKFVEDVVRDVLGRILVKYKELPNSVNIVVKSESEESIHKHNAFAERITTLGELRS